MVNCCFGGSDMSTLAVTITQGHFFKAQTNRVGWAMYPLLVSYESTVDNFGAELGGFTRGRALLFQSGGYTPRRKSPWGTRGGSPCSWRKSFFPAAADLFGSGSAGLGLIL